VVQRLHKPGPFLVVVPLSTIAHWQREFLNWTGLNTIVYHGSAQDRQLMRQHEFAFAVDRPDTVGANQLYLKKCTAFKQRGPWMAQVVITTPEMMVADDWSELASVPWEVLVVDEAHRLKNHNSKLAVNLRKSEFTFRHKILLTGTPIQNDVKEFWTLLNFIDPDAYDDMDAFMEEFGDMKSKDKIDELHETIRPYILRRLKEDVEKSVPPKEETLIETELTILQKQYYRALYEKNVKFLLKNKTKALDGPSLNNLAMQLRKCCNHLFLLNGVEVEVRGGEPRKSMSEEADFLARGSGKLVLLDKLLPRLKENGHRILIFSQFKIMLDILEDYLDLRQFRHERIDGSITGRRRQQAIDRFQNTNGSDAPFIMLLSTRAGGVGINLTAADTVIIFDSDWNPQNDLQAQARCHRIGQTKNVKVYRLLSRKTYEMQMFHMSSLKMGLDQAVLKGFESNASGEPTMTKEEVERLLRHGAYDIFNEDKAGSAEAESNDFVQQDIDAILERRSKTVIHSNTGSNSNAAGGTFSKASFKAPKTPNAKEGEAVEEVDIEDPDFWKKIVGEAKVRTLR
jgi:SNF2 family DNA or RNA helicase